VAAEVKARTALAQERPHVARALVLVARAERGGGPERRLVRQEHVERAARAQPPHLARGVEGRDGIVARTAAVDRDAAERADRERAPAPREGEAAAVGQVKNLGVRIGRVRRIVARREVGQVDEVFVISTNEHERRVDPPLGGGVGPQDLFGLVVALEVGREAQLVRVVLGEALGRLVEPVRRREGTQVAHLQDEVDRGAGFALPALDQAVGERQVPVHVTEHGDAQGALAPVARPARLAA
jgi:hypothetical protein